MVVLEIRGREQINKVGKRSPLYIDLPLDEANDNRYIRVAQRNLGIPSQLRSNFRLRATTPFSDITTLSAVLRLSAC